MSDYGKKLREEINLLETDLSMQALEAGLIKNDLTETLRPNIILSELGLYVLQMLKELNEYQHKNPLNDRMKASKQRLMKMLDLTRELASMGDKMQSLKLYNRELLAKIQLTRVENQRLKNENEAVKKAWGEA
jgi:hypothetical protein